MPQFDATIKHIKDGVKSLTVSAAVKNIEGWEATLEKLEAPGAKTIVKDLENLKKHLHAKELDGEAIRKLVAKLGKETVSLAGKGGRQERREGQGPRRGVERSRRERSRLAQQPVAKATGQMTKVFLLLFFKKAVFLAYRGRYCTASASKVRT